MAARAIGTRPGHALAGAFIQAVVHLERDGRLLCGAAPAGRSFIAVGLAVDAPGLVAGLRLHQHCVRRFHLIRDPATHVSG